MDVKIPRENLPARIYAVGLTCATDMIHVDFVAHATTREAAEAQRDRLAGRHRNDPSCIYSVTEIEIPKSIRAIDQKYGARAKFARVFHDGEDQGEVGCWIGENPHRFREVPMVPSHCGDNVVDDCEWTWNRKEREYLMALTSRSC